MIYIQMINQNSRITDKIKRLLGLSELTGYPRKVAESILPVLDVSPEKNIFVGDYSVADSIGGVAYTCSSKKRTFLAGASLSISKDIVNDGLYSYVRATAKDKKPEPILVLRYEPITALSNIAKDIYFILPIELEKGSTITVTNNTATASIDAHATFFLFEVEDVGD